MANDPLRAPHTCRTTSVRVLAVTCLFGAVRMAGAQTALADAPLFSTTSAPGNLSLVLSVEYPTAVSVAHSNRTYATSSTYLGYFDEAKCYTYTSSGADVTTAPAATPASYFVPYSYATAHVCNASGATGQWSGNFLNWASMQTIDTFRWVLTGGYRVLDTSSLTVIEKAWGSGQGGTGNFPDSSIPASAIAGATPFGALVAQGATALNIRIAGQGNQMRFYVAAPALKYNVLYYNCIDFLCRSIMPSPSTVTDFSALATDTSPAPTVNANYFGARYTTTITVPQTGVYSFGLMADDVASLYLNGSLVPIATATYLNSVFVGVPNPGLSISLNAGDTLSLRADYVQFTGGASLGIYWRLPGSSTLTPIGPPGGSLDTAYLDYKGGGVAVNTTYNAFMRGKMCDATVGLEANCVPYSGGYKPEGLLQKYNTKLRYSTFGYLNDGSSTRDAGVLRAAQKFIGPQAPVYGAPPVTNTVAEWDGTTGVLAPNPDCGPSNPAPPTGTQCPTSAAKSSGVINYINGFGELLRSGYKTYDPVSELYYAAIRYFKNLGDVPEWSNDLPKLAASDRNRLMDGFPVLTNPVDPIIGSCQRNFVLGIGDTHTWDDKNVPGNTNSSGEPSLPATVAADNPTGNVKEISPYNAVVATNKVGAMESGGTVTNLGTQLLDSGRQNSALIAGLAYDAHTTGIRSYTDGSKQTLDTYWLDVQEGGHYEPNNQYYLATKYGGFKVPDGYKPYDAGTSAPDPSTWWNGVDNLSYGGTTNKRPNNYYSAGAPDQMQAGLISAFQNLASASTNTLNSTSFALPVPQVSSSGSNSYAASYLPTTWTGDVSQYSLTLDPATGVPTVSSSPTWTFATVLGTQAAGTGWNLGRNIVTWSGSIGVPFRAGSSATSGVTSAQLSALDTSYIVGDDKTNDLNYLRGDRTYEIPATGTATSGQVYRTRTNLVGDIVNSKPVVVAAPLFPYADNTNPGYSSFKSVSRNSVVYVGANDGMLHAINSADGKELFAYVPAALFLGPTNTPSVNGLASLGNPAFQHHYMVDGPIDYFDVDFGRAGSASTTAPADWRTVLIGSLGKGGKAYYALDITSPSSITTESAAASKVLWEYSDPQALGYTYGAPVVVKTRQYGWVAILPSGYNNGDGVGHLIFLNPKTGAVLDKVDLPSGSSGLAQINAFVPDPTEMTADAVYGGDLAGNLWRVDITQTSGAHYPAAVKFAQLTDNSTSSPSGQPVTIYPQIQIDPVTLRRFVMVATGRLLDTSDITSSQVQSFYALWDGGKSFGAFSVKPQSSAKTVTFPITRAMLLNVKDTDTVTNKGALDLSTYSGWVEDLSTVDASLNPSSSVTQRVVTPLTTTYGEVAFATTIPTPAMCSPGGSSQTYALAFGSAQSVLLGTTVGYVPSQTAATDLSFFSNNGQSVLIQGSPLTTSKLPSTLTPLPTKGLDPTLPRRVNWRELPMVD